MHALLALILVLASTGEETEAFTTAVRSSALGNHREAVDALVALADRSPQDTLADDALFKAAQICEENLADPARAVELYERVIAAYADSRLARRAERRVEALRRGLGDGRWAETLGAYQAILTRYGQGDRLAAIEEMSRLVERSPEFPLAGEARFWIGTAYRHDGRIDEAIEWFRTAQRATADPELGWRASKAEADALLSRGDHSQAEAIYRQLPTDTAARKQMVDSALDRASRERGRARLVIVAWLVVVGFGVAMALAIWRAAGSLAAAARAMARPPTELIFLVPVAAVWIAIAAHGNTLVARAVVFIALGGIAITWLSGTAIAVARAAGKLGRRRLVAHAAAAALAVAAICYLAVESERLIDLIDETVKFGPG